MQSSPSANCAKHPWQPMLGSCFRCGDFVCVRCSVQRASGLVCETCVDRVADDAEALPHDQEGARLVPFYETIRLVLREPYRTFSRLSDGSIASAVTFSSACAVLVSALSSLVEGEPLSSMVGRSLLMGLLIWVTLFLGAGWLFLIARFAAARLSFSLAIRTEGYTTAWLLPALVSNVALWMGSTSVPLAWLFTVAGLLLESGGRCYSVFALMRGRAGLPVNRAALVAVFSRLPWTVMTLVMIWRRTGD